MVSWRVVLTLVVTMASLPAQNALKLARPKSWTGLASFAFAPDGRQVAGGTGTFTMNGSVSGGDVLLWDTRRGKLVKTLSGHRSAVTAIAFTSDGKQVVSFSAADGVVSVFDRKRGKRKRGFEVPAVDPEWVSVPALLATDGAVLARFAQEELDLAGTKKRIIGALELWDVAAGTVRWRRERTFAETATFSPDGSLVAYYAQELNYEIKNGEVSYSPPNSVVRVLQTKDGSEFRAIQVGWNPVNGLAISPDNSTLVAINEELRRYGLADGKQIGKAVAGDALPSRITAQIRADGKALALSSTFSNDLVLWDLAGAEPTSRKAELVEGVQPPMVMAPDFSRLLVDVAGSPVLLDLTGKKGKSGKKGAGRGR